MAPTCPMPTRFRGTGHTRPKFAGRYSGKVSLDEVDRRVGVVEGHHPYEPCFPCAHATHAATPLCPRANFTHVAHITRAPVRAQKSVRFGSAGGSRPWQRPWICSARSRSRRLLCCPRPPPCSRHRGVILSFKVSRRRYRRRKERAPSPPVASGKGGSCRWFLP